MQRPSNNPAPRTSPVARLALSLHDPASSGVVDVADLRLEPTPWSLAPPGPPPAAEPEAPAPRGPSRTALVAVVSALGATAAALAVAVAVSPEPTLVIRDAPTHEPQLAMQEREAKPEHTAIEHGPDETPPSDEARATTTADAAATEPAVTPSSTEPRATTRKTKRKTNKRRTASKATAPRTTATPTDRRSTPSDLPVECVLDPAACDRGTTGTSRKRPTGSSTLPHKLGATAVRGALADHKAAAKRCGPQHGAKAGTAVQTKLSINGHDGSVASAAALGEHASSALGRCVAAALSRTKFPRFTAPKMGLVYTVRL